MEARYPFYAAYHTENLVTEAELRRMYPEKWKDIDAARAAKAEANAAAVYFEPYMQATGEYLEYACGRALT